MNADIALASLCPTEFGRGYPLQLQCILLGPNCDVSWNLA